MKKKSVIISSSIGTIVSLFLSMTYVGVVPSVSSSNNSCVDIDCIKEKLRQICETNPKPEYLDCQNILRCMDAGEQEIMRECARAYSLLENETRICNSQDLLLRSWCDYTRGTIPK
jgi:hypothetical protein